ncbi:MAG: GNAT family N-acetyltransferase [Rhodospirillales bacterium]
MTVDVSIEGATTAADLEAVRALFVEYQRWLGVDLCFQGFAEELRSFPGRYAPPGGRLLLARGRDGAVAGVVGMWPLDADVCEMKRLFVRASWRGRGLGRRLAEAIVAAAVDVGYARMRLDTLQSMTEAVTLYRSMGFREIAPYYANPLADVVYLERELRRRPDVVGGGAEPGIG